MTQSDTGNAAKERRVFHTAADSTRWIADVREDNVGVLHQLGFVCSVAYSNGHRYMGLHEEDFRKQLCIFKSG